MRPICEATTEYAGSTYTCSKYSDHYGNHQHRGSDGEVYKEWPRMFVGTQYTVSLEPLETGVVLELTPEELKAIAYAAIGLEEDEPELVAKIDKALKEAL